jgi:hypothetical protein
LTKKQYEKIMQPVISAGLTKSHICRPFSTALIQAGSEPLGAGLPLLFTFQGIALLITLVSHSPGGSIMSLIFWAAPEAAFMEAGCGSSPWKPEFKALLQVITKTWTSSVVYFMAENFIDLHHNIRMDGYSQKESLVMANLIKQGASLPELTSMIQCCNFLRVSIISEVMTGCGS